MSDGGNSDASPGDPVRRQEILRGAIRTFARYGYRKTSMDDVAHDAGVSRPGLYFLFSNKKVLFEAAVRQLLDEALEQTRAALQGPDEPIDRRIADAIDHWLGGYVGGQSITDVGSLLESSQSQLGTTYSEYFGDCHPIRPAAIAGAVADGYAGLPDGAPASDAGATGYAAANDGKHRAPDRG